MKYLPETGSTNDYIKDHLHEFSKNFSGVYTFNQTQGKGQRGSLWECEPEQNIALTFCLTDISIDILNLSFWVPVVVRYFLAEITQLPVYIKWPNDIIIKNKKVCGILIEKSKNTFIVGIGINVLQQHFNNSPQASSLSLLTNKDYNLQELSMNLISKIKDNFPLLSENGLSLKEYNQYLFGKDKLISFLVNDEIQNGRVIEVDPNGLLTIEFKEKGIQKFRLKEIKFLY